MPGRDERLAALVAGVQHDLFSSVVLGQRFWTDDPLDVPNLHSEARISFHRLLDALRGQGTSRMMLVLGEVGAGKTHLLRALRASATHGYDAVCAYAQFNAPGSQFDAHFLNRLVQSCSERTSGNLSAEDAFARTFVRARALAPSIAAHLEEAWEAEDEDATSTGRLVIDLANALQAEIGQQVDPFTLRALIYANAPQHGIRALARQYLAGRPFSALDASLLPALPESGGTDRSQDQFHALAGALTNVGSGPLVYFFDQAEDLHAQGDEVPRRALESIYRLLDTVPNVVAMVSWEHTRYSAHFDNLPQFLQDRLNNGSVVHLKGERTVAEVRELITRRVDAAFAAAGVSADGDNPLDPLPSDLPKALAGGSTRTVLAKTREAIESIAVGGPERPPIDSDDDQLEHLETAWEAHLSNCPIPGELDDRELLKLAAWACEEAVTADGKPAASIRGIETNASVAWCDLHVPSTGSQLQVFALTRNPQGGGLLRQIRAARERLTERIPVGLRLAKFPGNPRTETVRHMIELFTPTGYRVESSEIDIQTILAYRAFITSDASRAAGFDRWKSQAKVLEQLQLVRGVLGLPDLANESRTSGVQDARQRDLDASPPPPEPNGRSTPAAPASSIGSSDLSIPIGAAKNGTSVAIPLGVLARHSAVLGGSGSGKTTLILRVVEQCLLRGIPAVLIDRKGDFAAYADPSTWSEALGADGAKLQEKITVSLFTPGKSTGRPLALRLLPSDYSTLDEEDRGEASRSAAEALGQMLGMGDKTTDRERREVLRQAIDQIGRQSREPLDLLTLIDGIVGEHPELDDRLSRLDPNSRHRDRLVPMLEQLRLSRGGFFNDREPLDFARLVQPEGTRSRLSIISLAFLPEISDQQFFVSRLLAEARRFCRTHPSSALQTLLVLDEADVFMPATSKPATKEPLLDLLRRARSGGMGIILGTQSPGDLDYKGRDNITTWALGRIQDNTALSKVTFVSEGTGLDVRSLLPGFTAGRFLLRSEGIGVSEVQADRSIVPTAQLPEERILELASRSASLSR